MTHEQRGFWRVCGAGLAIGLTALAGGGCPTTRHRIEVAATDPIRIDMNVRVDIYDHAKMIEQVVSGERPPEFETPMPEGAGGAPEGAQAPRAPGRLPALMVAAADAEDAVSPEDYQKAILQRRDRFAKIVALKEAGRVGEDRRGLIQARDAVDAAQKQLIADENRDRMIIYRYEATAKGVDLKEIQAAFAKVQRDQAKRGHWIEMRDPQTDEWRWVRKGEQ